MPQVVGHTTSITTVSFVTEGKKSTIVSKCQIQRVFFVGQARIQKTADCETLSIYLKLNQVSSMNQAYQT